MGRVIRSGFWAAVVAGGWTAVAGGGVRIAFVVDPADESRPPPAAIGQAERLLPDVSPVDRSAAELVVVVRWPAGAAAADGLTVVDPSTGGRLADRPLPPADAAAADAIAAAVRAALAKRDLPADRRRDLCLVSVRNADLAHASDAFCQAVAGRLQQRLADTPDLVVMDPGQLGRAPATRPAVAVTSVDLQLSWAGGGVDAKALLSDAAGRPLGAPAAGVRGPVGPADADTLADALADKVGAIVRAAAPVAPVPADVARRAEADRFRQEAALCWDHADRPAALRAAEAALALMPDDPAARAAAARGRLAVAAERLFEISDQGPAATDAPDLFPRGQFGRGVAPADLDESLRLAGSGIDLLAPAAAAGAAPDVVQAERLARGYLVAVGTAVYVGKSNLVQSKWDTTPQQRDALDAVRGSFRRFRMGCQPASAAAVASRDGFDRYSTFLYELLGDSLYCFSRDPGEWSDDVARLIPPYVELARRFDDPPGAGPGRHPLYPTGLAGVDPCGKLLYTLAGSWPQGTRGWGRVTLPRARPMARQTFAGPDIDRLTVAFVALGTDADQAFQKASLDGLKWAGRAPGTPPPVAAVPEPPLRRPDVLSGPPPAEVIPVDPLPFWKDVQHLVEARPAAEGVQRLFCPVVVGPDVFVVAMVQDAPRGAVRAQLWKLDPTGRRGPAIVGEDADPAAYRDFANADGEKPADHVTADWPGTAAAVCGDTYVFTCSGRRVLLFPLAGGDPRVATPDGLGCPGSGVRAATLLGDTLFVALGDGRLLADHLPTDRVDTLADGRRRDRLSPFDDAAPMYVSALIADPARRRVVFHAAAPAWPAGRGGLYAFDVTPPAATRPASTEPMVTTGTFRQLVPDRAPPTGDLPEEISPPVVVSRSPTVASQWRVAGCGQTYIYDLATDRRSPVPVLNTNDPNNTFWDVYPWDGGPAAAAGDWVTREIDDEVQPNPHADWGRINARTGRRQMFPMLRGGERGGILPCSCWPVYVADAGGGRVLVGDEVGLWTVIPPDDVTLQLDGRPPPPPPPPPSAQPPPAGGQLPWSAGRTLVDLSCPGPADAGLDFIADPRARGDDVYALALGHAGAGQAAKAFARLVRFPAAGEPRQDLASIPVDRPIWPLDAEPAAWRQWSFAFAQGSALGGREMYVAADDRLTALPLDGSPARRLTDPAAVRCGGGVCCLGGQVYFVARGNTGQVIARCDPATGDVAVLLDTARPGHAGGGGLMGTAADTRLAVPPAVGTAPTPDGYARQRVAERARWKARQAAFLAADQTDIPFLAADPARGRLLFVAQGTRPDPAADGLWAVDVATARTGRLVPLRLRSWLARSDRAGDPIPVLDWTDTADDGTVLLSTNAGLIGFDPRTDTARPIYQTPGWRLLPTAAPATAASADDNDLLADRIVLSPPYAVGGGWVWSARAPLVRASTDGRTFQQFPGLRPDDGEVRMMVTLQLFAGGRRLLVADRVGCWVLDLTP